MENVMKVAIDAIKGVVAEYTKSQTSEALRAAFIEMNGGSTKINPKTFYRGNQLFDLVQDIIPVMIEEGLNENNPIFSLVDYRNIADGDENEFDTTGVAEFIVADAAAGIAGVRRQRIADGESVTVKTTVKIVKVYENLGRLLAGRITFDQFVEGVATSFKKQINADAYAAINGLASTTAGLNSTYVKTGSFAEATLLTLIEDVEAATGKTARIYATKTALRKVTTAVVSDEAKTDLYNIGYYGKFNGTEMISLKQAHKADGTFAMSDSKIYVIAGDDKPIKMVNEGTGLLAQKEAMSNNDLTQEYVYGQAYGTGAICAEKLGVYTIS